MRGRLVALGGALVAAALVTGPPSAAAAPVARTAGTACADEDLVPAADNLPRVEAAVLCVLNRERARANLAPLARAAQLDRSAQFHTAHMVRWHYLAHEAEGHPSLLARVRGFGYFTGARDGYYAENVGAGPASNGTARLVMEAWMQSATHRNNILYPTFRDVGIAAVPAPPDRAFFADFPSTVYTTDFGRRYMVPRCVRRSTRRTRTPRATPRWRYCR